MGHLEMVERDDERARVCQDHETVKDHLFFSNFFSSSPLFVSIYISHTFLAP
jgi:hypothetical protein